MDDTPRAFALLRRTVTYMRELIDGAMLTIGLLFAVAEVASRLLEPAHVLARSLHVLAAASAGFGAAFYAARSRTIYVDREWQQDQIPHPSWDAFGGSSYLRPSFDGVPPCTTSGPDLRELTLRYFRWSRDGDNRSSGLTALGNEEPWPWVWAQKPSIGSVVVVVGSDAAAASTLADVCGSRDPQLMTVVAIGDEQALRALDVGSGPTQIVAVLDADVHSIDWEAGCAAHVSGPWTDSSNAHTMRCDQSRCLAPPSQAATDDTAVGRGWREAQAAAVELASGGAHTVL